MRITILKFDSLTNHQNKKTGDHPVFLFFALAGRRLPNDPLQIFPLRDFLSPFPIRLVFSSIKLLKCKQISKSFLLILEGEIDLVRTPILATPYQFFAELQVHLITDIDFRKRKTQRYLVPLEFLGDLV